MDIPTFPLSDYSRLEEHFRGSGQQNSPVVIGQDGNYSVHPTHPPYPMDGFWSAQRHDIADFGKQTGWKLHVSIDNDHMQRAYKIIADTLMEAGVGAFKVAAPDAALAFNNPADRQAGKMVTIYDFEKGPDLQPVMQELERRLDGLQMRLGPEGKTLAGPEVKNDRPISGSNYLYYRNDRDETGQYIDINQLQSSGTPSASPHNPSSKPDPWEAVKIDRNYKGENWPPPRREGPPEVEEQTTRRNGRAAAMPWMEEPTREVPKLTPEMLASPKERAVQEGKALHEALNRPPPLPASMQNVPDQSQSVALPPPSRTR